MVTESGRGGRAHTSRNLFACSESRKVTNPNPRPSMSTMSLMSPLQDIKQRLMCQ